MAEEFRTVGEYPNLGRQAIRTPVNPMDKSTVISIFPTKIDEVKHTTFPGRFILEPGTYEEPSVLVVGASSWWKETDAHQPLLEVPEGSPTVANSIVVDYSQGLFQCDMGERMPGLFWMPGPLGLENQTDSLGKFDIELARQQIAHEHQHLLDVARTKQRAWYKALVEAADSMWARSDHNPRCISGFMKIAAEDLQLDKDWLRDERTMKKANCPYCGNLRDANYPVCSFCNNVVDKVMYETLGGIQASA